MEGWTPRRSGRMPLRVASATLATSRGFEVKMTAPIQPPNGTAARNLRHKSPFEMHGAMERRVTNYYNSLSLSPPLLSWGVEAPARNVHSAVPPRMERLWTLRFRRSVNHLRSGPGNGFHEYA